MDVLIGGLVLAGVYIVSGLLMALVDRIERRLKNRSVSDTDPPDFRGPK